MNKVDFGPAVIIVFLVLITMLFSTFFSARLAQLKNRSRAWGILGFLLNIVGLLIVCFLPSRRNDGAQTNPLTGAASRLPSMSRKTIGIIAALAIAAIVTIVIYDNVPDMIQNYRYSKQVLAEEEDADEQARTVNAVLTGVFAGGENTFAVADNGDLYSWGAQLCPQLENKPAGVIFENAQKALSTGDALFVLTQDGKLYGRGANPHGQIPIPEKEAEDFTLISEDVTDFAVSETGLGFIKSSGKLYTCGENAFGQLGTYDKLPVTEPAAVIGNVRKVCMEATFTLVLQNDGEAVAFGDNTFGQFGVEGAEFLTPVSLGKGVSDIAAGDDFILLLKDGAVYSCGKNDHGQLGNGTTERSGEFVKVLDEASSVYAAGRSAYALNADGQLKAWGQNNVGQLGNGKTADLTEPANVAKNVRMIAVSGRHAAALTDKGKLLGTGFNGKNQLGRAGAASSFEAITTVR